MGLGFANAEMCIDAALECCVQLVGAVEMRGGLDILSLKAEPDAGIPVVHLGAAARDDADTFLSFHFYPEEDQPPTNRFPVACQRADGCALFIHHLFVQEIIQDRSEVDHGGVRQRVLPVPGFLIDGTLLLGKWPGSFHEIAVSFLFALQPPRGGCRAFY